MQLAAFAVSPLLTRPGFGALRVCSLPCNSPVRDSPKPAAFVPPDFHRHQGWAASCWGPAWRPSPSTATRQGDTPPAVAIEPVVLTGNELPR